jgi:hypothetical protein
VQGVVMAIHLDGAALVQREAVPSGRARGSSGCADVAASYFDLKNPASGYLWVSGDCCWLGVRVGFGSGVGFML